MATRGISTTSNPVEGNSVKEFAQKALQANKDHQYALKVYTERLEAELQTIDKMLNIADIADDDDDEPELDAGGYVLVPNSIKPTLPISSHDFLSEDSPFREDAEKRTRYINYTAMHSMKKKELEVLAEAVRTENHRRRALEAQKGGLPSFANRDDNSQDFFEWNTEGIDWDRVAEKVSSVVSLPRTARDCAIRWLGDRHPQFVHGPWTEAELDKLQAFLTASEEPFDWVEIAKKLGNHRTPLDCMRHGIHRKQHTWTPESSDALLKAVSVYGLNNWIVVASHVSEDATPQQCQTRFTRTLDPNIQRGGWSLEEDARLRLAAAAYGNSWMEVAEVIAGRTNEQCRDRWSDKINPNITKGKWTDDEDKLLLEAVESMGTNWKGVSERLGNGRTDSNCRARYDKLGQTTQKKPKAVVSKSQSKQPPSMDGVQTEIQEAGPSAPPRPPVEVVPAADKQQPIARPRPKPRPRAKQKVAELPEETNSSAGSAMKEPTAEPEHDTASRDKGKGRATMATSDENAVVRKRKSRNTDDAEGEAPSKKRGGSTRTQPVPIREENDDAGAVATVQATRAEYGGTANVQALEAEDGSSSRPSVTSPSTALQESALQAHLDANWEVHQGDESVAVTDTTAKGKKVKRKVIAVEPTRKQPSRSASKKAAS